MNNECPERPAPAAAPVSGLPPFLKEIFPTVVGIPAPQGKGVGGKGVGGTGGGDKGSGDKGGGEKGSGDKGGGGPGGAVCFCGQVVETSRLWPTRVLGPKPLPIGRPSAPPACAGCLRPLCAAHATAWYPPALLFENIDTTSSRPTIDEAPPSRPFQLRAAGFQDLALLRRRARPHRPCHHQHHHQL